MRSTEVRTEIVARHKIPAARTKLALWAVVLAMVLGLGVLPGVCAEEVTFNAVVDKEKVALGDRLVLSLTITGAQNATAPQLPPLDSFAITSSGTTTQFNFINGRMFASRCFTYVLLPQKVGTFTIGAAQWEYDGKQYNTDPIRVEVVPENVQTAKPAYGMQPGTYSQPRQTHQTAAQSGDEQVDLGDRLFIQVKTDKEEAYLNDQVILIFRLFWKNLNLDDLQYTAPAATGFIEESLGKQKESREYINGVLYNVIELKTALFPASTGDLTIGPATLKCNVLVRTRQQQSESGGFFGGLFDESVFGGDPFFERLAKYPIELKSKPVTIRINPLPKENKPADFHGAVGDFQLEAWLKPAKLKVGEPANLTMKVMGTGNVSGLSIPTVGDVEGFKTYDSESKVNMQERIDTIGGEKIFEKVLIPQKAGKLKIPPVKFSFFNPRTGKYETLSEGPFWLDVEESAEGSAPVVVVAAGGAMTAKEDVQILKRDILFIKEKIGAVHVPAKDLENGPIFWWAQIFPLLLLAGTMALERRFQRVSSDVRLVRFRKAFASAKVGLRRAEKLMGAGADLGPFYQALSRSLSEYVCDRWNLPSGEITPQEVATVLWPKGLEPALASRTQQIIERIDLGRFAHGAMGAGEAQELYKQTVSLIKDLERATR